MHGEALKTNSVLYKTASPCWWNVQMDSPANWWHLWRMRWSGLYPGWC